MNRLSRRARLEVWEQEKHAESHAQFAATGGFRLHWKQTGVDAAMSGADERDTGCPTCGNFNGLHWIGCPTHVYQVLTRRPVEDLRIARYVHRVVYFQIERRSGFDPTDPSVLVQL